VVLTCHHILSSHGIDINKNIKVSLILAQKAFGLLKAKRISHKDLDYFE